MIASWLLRRSPRTGSWLRQTNSVKGQVHTISDFGGSDKRQPDLIINGGAQTLDGARRP
jgi:hypothetical protein